MVLEDELSCVFDRLYVSVAVAHHAGVEQSCFKGKGITALTGNYLNTQMFYETVKTKKKAQRTVTCT
jgi:hypothetical protein